jgi:hypothetical protein
VQVEHQRQARLAVVGVRHEQPVLALAAAGGQRVVGNATGVSDRASGRLYDSLASRVAFRGRFAVIARFCRPVRLTR